MFVDQWAEILDDARFHSTTATRKRQDGTANTKLHMILFSFRKKTGEVFTLFTFSLMRPFDYLYIYI